MNRDVNGMELASLAIDILNCYVMYRRVKTRINTLRMRADSPLMDGPHRAR